MRAILLLTLTFLLTLPGAAQVQLSDLSLRAGATRASWSNFFQGNSRYQAAYGSYLGVASRVSLKPHQRQSWLELNLGHRFVQAGYKYSPNHFEFQEVVVGVRPTLAVRRWRFGIEGNWAVSVSKTYVEKDIELRRPATFLKRSYASVGGIIGYQLAERLTIELQQSGLQSRIASFTDCRMGGLRCYNRLRYQRVTQLGFRYRLRAGKE